jgi:hypothetical protein
MEATDKATPDADLIALCAQHKIARDDVNAEPDDMEDDDPVWLAYDHTRDAITASRPLTMAGIVAKAKAARFEGRHLDGTVGTPSSTADHWAWDITSDLLRLHGEAI